jgi:hypothetical protein
MADRGEYVDIFFRNGLKEFEVLPPPDIWENLQPVIRKRQKSSNIFRFAAIAAILLSLSVFSFWLTKELSKDFSGQAISLNQEVIPAGFYVAKNQPVATPSIEIPVANSGITDPVVVNENHSSELIYLKMPSAGLFSVTNKVSKLQKGLEPVIPSGDIIANSNSAEIEKLNLTPGNFLSENSENEINRWTVSAMASPNYFSSVSFGKNDASNDLVNSEKPSTSYTGGMTFSYNVNKRISVQSGVYYSSIGQKVTGISSFSGFRNYYDAKGSSEFSIQTSSGTIVSTNNDIFLRDNIAARVLTRYTIDSFDPTKADLIYLNNYVTQNFNYLEIPILLKYKAIDRKIDINFIGGISYNMLVGNSAFAYVSGVKRSIGKTEGLSPVNFSSSLGLGFEYNLSEKTSLSLEPTFRYYLTPLGGLVGSSIHPYSFGIFSGLSYKF